jgi:hypothetical protein
MAEEEPVSQPDAQMKPAPPPSELAARVQIALARLAAVDVRESEPAITLRLEQE